MDKDNMKNRHHFFRVTRCVYVVCILKFKIKIFLTLCSKRLTDSAICSHIKKIKSSLY